MKPSRVLSAYIYFSMQSVPGLRKEGVSQVDAMKLAGDLWSKMTLEEKDPYIKKHEQDIKR